MRLPVVSVLVRKRSSMTQTHFPKREKDPAHVASGRASQAPDALALRIARKWPDLSPRDQNVIKAALVPLLCAGHSGEGGNG
jgi:hypothetical protein